MATIFKCTMIFDGPKHGWTESHWYNSPVNDYNQMRADLSSLAIARSTMLGKQCRIIGLRVSDIAIKNDAFSKDVQYDGNAAQNCAEPDVALMCTGRDVEFRRSKKIYLRGIWDSIEDEFGIFRPIPAWANAYESYQNLLVGKDLQWGWIGTREAGPTRAFVQSYTQLTSGHVVFTLGADLFEGLPNVPTKVTVNFSGINAPDKSTLNGPIVCFRTGQFTLRTVFPYGVFPSRNNGVAKYNPTQFYRYARVEQQRIVTRRVGAPLLASRGRARVRAKG